PSMQTVTTIGLDIAKSVFRRWGQMINASTSMIPIPITSTAGGLQLLDVTIAVRAREHWSRRRGCPWSYVKMAWAVGCESRSDWKAFRTSDAFVGRPSADGHPWL